ncbi:hypothetical protein ElyMa_004221000 [Elysia marginata]|uniref:Uncharacterized protein n=1 Tax=Elysia marginata TaxID=1093978 RepID=A0AAV4GPN8_9GAST|nr:hypothetical protein ElyMa_004221000 [Elysia marginata]
MMLQTFFNPSLRLSSPPTTKRGTPSPASSRPAAASTTNWLQFQFQFQLFGISQCIRYKSSQCLWTMQELWSFQRPLLLQAGAHAHEMEGKERETALFTWSWKEMASACGTIAELTGEIL